MQPPPPAPGQYPPGYPPGVPGGPPGFTPPPAGTYGQMAPPPRPTSTDAIVALILGVLTMSTACFPMGFVALYFGSKARKKAAEEGDTGSNATMALIGMVIGGVFGTLWLLFWLFEIVMILFGVGMAVFHP